MVLHCWLVWCCLSAGDTHTYSPNNLQFNRIGAGSATQFANVPFFTARSLFISLSSLFFIFFFSTTVFMYDLVSSYCAFYLGVVEKFFCIEAPIENVRNGSRVRKCCNIVVLLETLNWFKMAASTIFADTTSNTCFYQKWNTDDGTVQ